MTGVISLAAHPIAQAREAERKARADRLAALLAEQRPLDRERMEQLLDAGWCPDDDQPGGQAA